MSIKVPMAGHGLVFGGVGGVLSRAPEQTDACGGQIAAVTR